MEKIAKIATTIVAVFGLLFGILQYLQVQQIQASQPYLIKKLSWCLEAVETTSGIANDSVDAELKRQRFYELYWGVMGLVERNQIIEGMNGFRRALENNGNLKTASLNLAHACREELGQDWSSKWFR